MCVKIDCSVISIVYYIVMSMITSMETEHPPNPMTSGIGVGDVPGMDTLLSIIVLHLLSNNV